MGNQKGKFTYVKNMAFAKHGERQLVCALGNVNMCTWNFK
jgi:hypothetical protein